MFKVISREHLLKKIPLENVSYIKGFDHQSELIPTVINIAIAWNTGTVDFEDTGVCSIDGYYIPHSASDVKQYMENNPEYKTFLIKVADNLIKITS